MSDTRTVQTPQGPVTLSTRIDDDLVEQMQQADPDKQPPEEFLRWLRKEAAARKK